MYQASPVAHARAAEVVHGDLRCRVSSAMIKSGEGSERSAERVSGHKHVPFLTYSVSTTASNDRPRKERSGTENQAKTKSELSIGNHHRCGHQCFDDHEINNGTDKLAIGGKTKEED